MGPAGELGCGKSTTGKLALGLIPPSSGSVRYDGADMPRRRRAAWRALRRRIQMVYQDPWARSTGAFPSASRSWSRFPSTARRIRSNAATAPTPSWMRSACRSTFGRYPHELSGGQRQRVVLARALMTEPTGWSATSRSPPSTRRSRRRSWNLLLDLQERLGIAYLFISHDLRIVRQVSHDVAVMYLGRVVEQGEAEEPFARPAYPDTRALVSAIPVPISAQDPRREHLLLQGDPPNPVDVPSGCAFHTRCPFAAAECRHETPSLRPQADGRLVACHRIDEPALRVAA